MATERAEDPVGRAAQREFECGHYDLALSLFADAAPQTARVHLQRAKCCQYLARPRQALEHCHRALAAESKWAEAFHLRSAIFQAWQQAVLDGAADAGQADGPDFRARARLVVNAALEAPTVTSAVQGQTHVRRLDQALSLARDGDVVFLEPGHYETSALDEDHGLSPCFIHGQNLTLVGSSVRDCVLTYRSGPESPSGPARKLNTFLICATESDTPTLIKNLTFRNLNAESSGTRTKFLGVASGRVIIEDCLFDGLECPAVDAIFANPQICGHLARNYPPPHLTIRYCIFDHCQSFAAIALTQARVEIESSYFIGSRLSANDGSEVSLSNCEFVQTGDQAQQCISVSQSRVSVSGCYIHGLRPSLNSSARNSLGISLTLGSQGRISNNFLYLCGNGIACQDSNMVCQSNLIFHCAQRFSEAGQSLGLPGPRGSSTLGLHSAISLTCPAAKLVVADNYIKKCDIGIYVSGQAMPTLKSNRVESSHFTGLFVQSTARPNILGNHFVGATHESLARPNCSGIGVLLIMGAGGLIGKNNFENYDLSPIMVFGSCHPMLKGNLFDNINLDREKQAQTEEKMKLLFQPESLRKDTFFYIVDSELSENELRDEILTNQMTIFAEELAKMPVPAEPAEKKDPKVALQSQKSISSVREMDTKHPLQHSWSLWYFKNDRSKTWEDNLREVVTFNTVEDFWSIYNHIEMASRLSMSCDYSVFKAGIKPMWEVPANMKGGRWLINIDKKCRHSMLDNVWLELLLAMIGESFGEDGSNVNGAVVNVRNRGDKVALWLSNSDAGPSVMKIGKEVKRKLNLNMEIAFEAHEDAMSKNGSTTRSSFVI